MSLTFPSSGLSRLTMHRPLPLYEVPALSPDIEAVELFSASQARPGTEAVGLRFADGERVEFALHEYDKLFGMPGLYEAVVQQRLACNTPDVLASALSGHLLETKGEHHGASVIDLGCGNGVSALALSRRNIRTAVGIDFPGAQQAAQRDYPGLIGSFKSEIPTKDVRSFVRSSGARILTASGALGGGHVQLEDFERLWDAFPVGSLLCVTIPDTKADPNNEFGSFLRNSNQRGLVQLRRQRFCHRRRMTAALSVDDAAVLSSARRAPEEDLALLERVKPTDTSAEDWYISTLFMARKTKTSAA